jgi:hypothetical protein
MIVAEIFSRLSRPSRQARVEIRCEAYGPDQKANDGAQARRSKGRRMILNTDPTSRQPMTCQNEGSYTNG